METPPSPGSCGARAAHRCGLWVSPPRSGLGLLVNIIHPSFKLGAEEPAGITRTSAGRGFIFGEKIILLLKKAEEGSPGGARDGFSVTGKAPRKFPLPSLGSWDRALVFAGSSLRTSIPEE